MNEIKAIIFDMDGVLVEARDWHYEAFNKALNLFGLEISRKDHLFKYDGLPTKDKLKILTDQYGLPSKLHKFINELKQKYTMRIIHTNCNPSFIHEYALYNFKKEGYRMAVASNSIRITIDTIMNYTNLSDYLEFYLSNEDVEKGKPDPEVYIRAIKRFKLLPTECLIIEDNPNGIKAAEGSGAWVMEVEGPHDVTYQKIKSYISGIEAKKS